ncbi:hypothetical protein E6W39_09230 [Kitasatospora acidiphila]|uniref:Aminoacyl-transfer RNA synthetases class-II family profile domain-containing protein n=1 Tax=Kitasatospora acidiphila TaxID=2567942 RepID=A0A540W083_9ACTN|nr:hypothetical protein [Kitasatospora acidiphila]TQF02418.1 hypothetical protein E6W39_09230 [Kitasatospora acidiphila]
MDRVTYQHPRPIGPGSADELRKALAFYYGRAEVTELSPGVAVAVPAQAGLTEQELADIVRHFLRGHREVSTTVVAEHTPQLSCALPDDDRIAVAGGTYLHGPEWGAAMAGTRRLVYERFAAEFEAPRLTGSAQIQRDTLVRAGYYKKFPNLVNAVSRIRADYWDGVSVARLRPGQLAALDSYYAPSEMVLNPVTCYHVYSNARLLHERYGSGGRYAIEGPVFRHESHNHGPTRLAEFSMFELVRLGGADEVRGEFERLLKAFESFFAGLGVPHRIISASDAFFGDDPSMTRDAQLLNGSKFEVRVPLEAGELSVASVNLHGEVFADAFALRDLGVEATCCAGIGLDRLAYALLSYGLLPAEQS